ncbi:MAG: ABC transporter permease subunit [bacterium]
MIASLRAEVVRLGRWPTTWIIVGVWLVLNLTFGYLFSYLSYRSGSGGGFADEVPDGGAAALLEQMAPASVPEAMVAGLPMFGGALLITLGALAVGSGYGWGTWKTVFTTGLRRSRVLGGTLGALGLVLAVVVALTLAFDLLAAFAVASAESQPATWPTLADTARGVGAALLIGGMWLAGGVLLGTLTRGPALAVGLGLVWALVVENLLRGAAGLLDGLETVTDLLPGTAAGSVVGALGVLTQSEPNGTPGVMTVLSGATAAVLLGGYIAVFLGASTVLTARRDV